MLLGVDETLKQWRKEVTVSFFSVTFRHNIGMLFAHM